jgi:hypothetical protein
VELVPCSADALGLTVASIPPLAAVESPLPMAISCRLGIGGPFSSPTDAARQDEHAGDLGLAGVLAGDEHTAVNLRLRSALSILWGR